MELIQGESVHKTKTTGDKHLIIFIAYSYNHTLLSYNFIKIIQ